LEHAAYAPHCKLFLYQLPRPQRRRPHRTAPDLVDVDQFEDHNSRSMLAKPNGKTPTVYRSAMVRSLMEILDHWRMDNRRLVVLMQALERFVVKEIINTRPYAIANVQIWLNEEELPWEEGGNGNKIMTKTSSIGAMKHSDIRDVESKCKFLRGAAVTALFWYCKYKFKELILEIYLTKEDVPWLQISSLFSFTGYSADD
jgi:hypothetical protein